MKSVNWKITLSLVWLVLTFSLVTWWFIFALHLQEPLVGVNLLRHQRMIFWEGSTLLTAVLLGGVVLIFYSHRDAKRHDRLRFFFAHFSHDMKTAITRLRLQAEILHENKTQDSQKTLERLLREATRLDLQLENSLLLTHMDEALYLNEKINLLDLVASLQIEFDGLIIVSQSEAEILGDSQALRSVFRNLFENSIRHGKARRIEIGVNAKEQGWVEIRLQDDGQGTQRKLKDLGNTILPEKENQGSGIGLYLVKKLIKKMEGSIEFDSEVGKGFCTRLTLRGNLK